MALYIKYLNYAHGKVWFVTNSLHLKTDWHRERLVRLYNLEANSGDTMFIPIEDL